ncbi:glycosyltransferase [Candidatus Woesearchaeota archaeon]|nr:glycosyltransferase [Candidatus Woesearchaeota archaeon]
MPYISIVIPAHNEENYIRQTLHSIHNQTYQDYEVIVVTNGCTDATEEIVRRRENDKLKLLSLPIANVSRARNYGAGKAQGELLLFLDADTRLEQDSLQKIKDQFLSSHAIATTKAKPDSPELKYTWALWFKNMYLRTKLYEGCSGALICRREDFDKVNGYDPEIIVKEHRKLIIKLKKAGKYKCLDTTVTTSMRRFQRWGLLKTTGFWLGQWVKDYVGDLKKSKYEKIR